MRCRNITIADDDSENKEMLKEAIEKICPDVNITDADDGASLLKILKTTPKPDIIILDINMPVMDGKECLKEIKSKNNMSDIPVMMYSTSTNKEDIREALAIGADYYVVKPDSISAMYKLAEEICTGNIKSL